MDWALENAENIAAAFGALVAFASIVVKLTPSKADDKFVVKLLKFVSIAKGKK